MGSIAVFHHFSSHERRVQALSEIARIVRPGGSILIYAWAQEQGSDSRRRFASQDVLVPWHHRTTAKRKRDKSPSQPNGGTNPNDRKDSASAARDGSSQNPTIYQRY